MTAFKPNLAVSATALLVALSAGPAFADVTAQQVWDDWKAQMGLYGEDAVTIGSESQEGDVLTVTDLGFDITGEDGSTATGNLPELVFTENGDGTVTVTMSEEYPITITTPADPGTGSEASEIALALRQNGMTMTVSGDPGALTYDVAAARYAVELDRLSEGGSDVPAEALLAFNDVSGRYTSNTGTMRDLGYDLGAASMDLLIDATNPEDGSHLMLSGKVNTVATQAAVTLPLDPATDPEMLLMNGMAVDGGYTTANGSYMFEMTDSSGTSSGNFTTQGSEMSFRLSKDAVAYNSTAKNVALDVTTSAMPMPITASIAQYGITFEMPLSKTQAPAPWALGLNLTDLALNEEIWGMFDPQGLLPHDPASLVLDMTGTATLLFDAVDPAQAEAMAAAEMPAQVNSADLNDLRITFGGAEITGSGAFTFDNSDLTTFPGVPRPAGAVDLQLNGVNGLIDGLVALGLLPEDQVMGARMMLGAFTTPVGDDQLTSRIEVTEDGQLLANGQRLQ
ncbi:DUF2125 domain-containing protein [Rubellimicrobium rubrum]|uniref:DUF2125 domain-containing protein n=1 Tax=Rubellimicrobium rubrum TaxID=2585369 RepID=A0A5C4MXJ3_9RHOB|nr:DUF2125 domain-containing protein [Rubellimicrobium rubrum]TNC49783.1 DUF2125 domain-containing protein [Rubellimicrobium rubrum]